MQYHKDLTVVRMVQPRLAWASEIARLGEELRAPELAVPKPALEGLIPPVCVTLQYSTGCARMPPRMVDKVEQKAGGEGWRAWSKGGAPSRQSRALCHLRFPGEIR